MKKLLESEAERIGLEISPYELRLAVEQMPYFLNDEGKFDKDAYLRVLSSSGMTPAQFENGLKEDMLPQKLETLLTSGAWGSPEEARLRFMYDRQKRSVDYVLFPLSEYTASSAPSDAWKFRRPMKRLPPATRSLREWGWNMCCLIRKSSRILPPSATKPSRPPMRNARRSFPSRKRCMPVIF